MEDGVGHRHDDVVISVETGFTVNDNRVVSGVEVSVSCPRIAAVSRQQRLGKCGPQDTDPRLLAAVRHGGPAGLAPQLNLVIGSRYLKAEVGGVGTAVHDRGQQKATTSDGD